MDFKEFYSKLKIKYPNIISYEEYYTPEIEKTKIICVKHGEMKIMPLDVLKIGCPRCESICIHKEGKCNLCVGEPSDFNDIVTLAKQLNGDNYRYKKAKNDLIEINCKRHIPTLVTKDELLSGRICVWCKQDPKKNKFINEMIEKYGFSYDYSQVKYVNENTKVKLIGVNGEINKPPKLLLN